MQTVVKIGQFNNGTKPVDTALFFPETYQWVPSICALVATIAIPLLAKRLVLQVPTFRATQQTNKAIAREKMSKKFYRDIQKRSRKWGLSTNLAIFIVIVPFVVTTESQPWWQLPIDVFVILMVYDFFYYLVHRFLFHDGGFGPGPLLWVHAVHHQQRNPCRQDSNYLHPIETCLGLALYGFTLLALGLLLGDFHLLTIIITAIAFSEINLHNHDLQETDRFPYRYLKYMSDMHHVHHSRFTAGNYAIISLLYDGLFGTYDTGAGWQKAGRENQPAD